MVKKYRSDAFEAIHETMKALHDVGAISKEVMREFDEVPFTPEQIKAIPLLSIADQEQVANALLSPPEPALCSKLQRCE